MALTTARPEYTALQLNTVWTTVRNSLAGSISSSIETVAGQSNFSIIDIYDADGDIGTKIYNKEDVLSALIATANKRGAGYFKAILVPATASVNDYYFIEVRDTLSFPPNRKTFNRQINRFYDSLNPTAFYGQSSFQGNLSATGSTYVNSIVGGDTSAQPALLVRAKYYMATNTISVESYNQDTGLSSYSSNLYGSAERFTDAGYSGFYIGTGSIYTKTGFLTFSGYAYWGSGSGTTLGATETFDDGWPAGISPPSGGGGTSGDHYTEDLSAQIDGVSTTFTTTYGYMAGSLKVYWNGQRQYSGTVTETSSNTFSTTFTPTGGDVLIADYEILTT